MLTRKPLALPRERLVKVAAMIQRISRYGIIVSLLVLFVCFALLRPAIFPTLGNLISIGKSTVAVFTANGRGTER